MRPRKPARTARDRCRRPVDRPGRPGRPWIFREIEHFLRTGETLPAPELFEVERILLEHLAALHAFYGEVMGVRIARKHVGWYLATLPGAKEFRAHFNRVEDTEAQCANVREFFAERYKSLVTGEGRGWPHDDDDRDFSEWNNARERQRQFETAPQHAERRRPDPSRECREGAAQLFRPP
ncbi:tRNA-dihydrouridine synthase [Pseudomonas sp. PCH446]